MKPLPIPFTGLCWTVTPKAPKHKAVAPERTWERPDYLPYLDDAKAFNVNLFTTDELVQAQINREILVVDCEVYMNYFLVAFASLTTGKVFYLETTTVLDSESRAQLSWVLAHFKTVSFNGLGFDLPILALALAGQSTDQLKFATNQLIQQQVKPWMVLRGQKVQPLQIDHIDLMEVAPLKASLKIYGGRLHVPKMQELPFHPDLVLTPDQITCVRWYCINSDLTATAFLYMELEPQIKLREQMSVKYGIDLRSKSDAQIAEAVINTEYRRLTGVDAPRTEIAPGTSYRYWVPDYVRFSTPELQKVLDTIRNADFVIGESGSPMMPPTMKDLKVTVGTSTYQIGLGGLHSCEECRAVYGQAEKFGLSDVDCASYYPSIILNQRLSPAHLGDKFLDVYRSIVERRLKAKKDGNKVEADTLKITINGSFGKFGSKYSALYAPDLMLQVTLSGQLSLLMLIERLELAGIPVVSGNTDGILIKYPEEKRELMNSIIKQWEVETGFTTEETPYSAVFSRDVNSYVAVKTDGKAKTKGTYSEASLSKNPTNTICRDALIAFLTTGKPISATIRECRDIRRFLSVRTVKGGAVKDGAYLGKAIRWYASTVVTGEIIYAINGNRVPLSENCRPLMELPATFPEDVDFARYEAETFAMLKEIGYGL